MMKELHRNFVKQRTTPKPITNNEPCNSGNVSNIENEEDVEVSSHQVHKLSKNVPDLISWLSERQPVFSAANSMPKTSKNAIEESTKK